MIFQKLTGDCSGSASAAGRKALEERIREDKNTPGVRLQLKKSETDWDLVALMREKVITAADLDGFSEELKEYVLSRVKYRLPDEE